MRNGHEITLFLGGDLMTGRGIDQILPYPNDPAIHEPYVRNAGVYVDLAESANGPIPQPASYEYVWGDALEALEQAAPEARIVNLETAVTSSDTPWPAKGINYRMHPKNMPVLTAAGLDCCALANNHVLDWSYPGLHETLASLGQAGIRAAGAGADVQEADAPAALDLGAGRRLLVFSLGSRTSGIPSQWAAGGGDGAGLALLEELSERQASQLAARIASVRTPGDRVIVSVHWGGNWGYEVPAEQRTFARRLIDSGAADLVHGHSSHHAKGLEVYRGRLILYGCGDLLNDYEGIQGQGEYRDDLPLLYWPRLDADTGALLELRMSPMRIRRFRLERASAEEARWLEATLDRESRRLGAGVRLERDGSLALRWAAKPNHSGDLDR